MKFPSKEQFDSWFIKPRKAPYPLSGWKLHISGENEDDSTTIKSALEEIIEKYNLGWKLAKEEFFNLTNKKGKNQYKASTIYFPSDVINLGLQKEIVKDISNALAEKGYKKDFEIKGSKKIAASIYYRYDMDIPFRKEGFPREDYLKHYKTSGDNFNIENNKDIF